MQLLTLGARGNGALIHLQSRSRFGRNQGQYLLSQTRVDIKRMRIVWMATHLFFTERLGQRVNLLPLRNAIELSAGHNRDHVTRQQERLFILIHRRNLRSRFGVVIRHGRIEREHRVPLQRNARCFKRQVRRAINQEHGKQLNHREHDQRRVTMTFRFHRLHRLRIALADEFPLCRRNDQAEQQKAHRETSRMVEHEQVLDKIRNRQ